MILNGTRTQKENRTDAQVKSFLPVEIVHLCSSGLLAFSIQDNTIKIDTQSNSLSKDGARACRGTVPELVEGWFLSILRSMQVFID